MTDTATIADALSTGFALAVGEGETLLVGVPTVHDQVLRPAVAASRIRGRFGRSDLFEPPDPAAMTPRPAADRGELVGRGAEIDVLRSFIDCAGRSGEALVLVGDVGVGKTALLDVAAGRAISLGFEVVRVVGAEFEAEISFSALHQSLLPLRGGIEKLRPLYRDALSVALGIGEGRPPDRLVVSGAALDLVRRAGQEQPLLMVLDDVFWLDRPSAEALAFVARRLASSRVGVLAALRTATGSVFAGAGLPQYQLEPLGRDAADRLVRSRFPLLGPEMRRRLLAEAAGNPLALLELPVALSGRRPFAAPGSPALLPLSARLSELFGSRVEQLPPPTRRLLLLAVLDNTGDLATLQRATGDAEMHDLAPAERSRLVHVDPETRQLVFRHPLTRSAVVELSTARERREAHRALAGVQADDPLRRAWHLAEASVEPDEGVAGLLEATAREMLSRGDPVGAVTALTRAAELSPTDVDRSRRLTEAAFFGVNMAGRLGDSQEMVAVALEAKPGPRVSRQADVTAAFVLLNGDGDLDTVHGLLVRAIEAVGDELDATDEDLAAAIYLLLLVCGFAGRADLWGPYFAILDRLRPEVPEDLLLASRIFPDPVRDAVPLLDRLERVIAELGGGSDSWHVRKVMLAAVFIDRLAGCRQALRRTVKSSREAGAWTLVVSALNFICLDHFLTGEWDELELLLAECFEICDHAGLQLYVPVLRYDLALVAAARGDDALARELADAITSWAQPRGANLIAQFASHARELAALGCGDFEAAYHYASAIGRPGEFIRYNHHALWVCMDLVEAAVRTDRHAEAAAHVAAMRRYGIARISPRIALLAGGSAGLAAREDEAALAEFERALAIPGADRWPFDLARVRLAYGERLRRARAARAARAQLTAAHDAFQRLGATPWARRAAAELRAAGQAPAATNANGSAEPLTAQEYEIASLAAAGLTNKQIGERLYLSHRTVSGHLYRIFPKLGISSRAALRDALPN
jgi:DNA-binding CsgD family transcriptional regulator